MASDRNDGKGPRRPDEGDRSLLIGLSEGGEEAGEGAPLGAEDPPPGSAAALERIDARLGRLEAALAALDAKLQADGQSGSGLSEAVAKIVATAGEIARAAEAAAEIRRTTGEAARFTSDTKEATGVLQAEAGKQIAGLKEGRRDLDRAVAALKSREEGLKAREDALGKGIGELRALWKSVNERSRAVASEARSLAKSYESWREEAALHRHEMSALSKSLRDGGDKMGESVSKTAKSQLDISRRILGNVENFRGENDRFLERFAAGGEEVLGAIRRERKAVRRWTVPALSAALVMAVLSFPVLGSYAQSQFGVFDPYDDTNGWKQLMWDRHGGRVKACLIESERAGKVLRCGLRVDGRGIFGGPADALPPLPPPPARG